MEIKQKIRAIKELRDMDEQCGVKFYKLSSAVKTYYACESRFASRMAEERRKYNETTKSNVNQFSGDKGSNP